MSGKNGERHEQEPDRLRSMLHDLRQYVAAGLLLYEEGELTEDELRSRLHTGQMLFHQLSAVVDRESSGVHPPPVPIDVGELVEDCVSIFRHSHPGVHVQTSVRGRLACEIDREALHRALTNVVENAARAAGDGGRVTVSAWADTAEVLVEVSDDGRGFGQIPHGSGHGLQTVSEVVRSARGGLEIRSGPEAGTQVRLVIPAAQEVRP